jgi:hypothetical protein
MIRHNQFIDSNRVSFGTLLTNSERKLLISMTRYLTSEVEEMFAVDYSIKVNGTRLFLLGVALRFV